MDSLGRRLGLGLRAMNSRSVPLALSVKPLMAAYFRSVREAAALDRLVSLLLGDDAVLMATAWPVLRIFSGSKAPASNMQQQLSVATKMQRRPRVT